MGSFGGTYYVVRLNFVLEHLKTTDGCAGAVGNVNFFLYEQIKICILCF